MSLFNYHVDGDLEFQGRFIIDGSEYPGLIKFSHTKKTFTLDIQRIMQNISKNEDYNNINGTISNFHISCCDCTLTYRSVSNLVYNVERCIINKNINNGREKAFLGLKLTYDFCNSWICNNPFQINHSSNTWECRFSPQRSICLIQKKNFRLDFKFTDNISTKTQLPSYTWTIAMSFRKKQSLDEIDAHINSLKNLLYLMIFDYVDPIEVSLFEKEYLNEYPYLRLYDSTNFKGSWLGFIAPLTEDTKYYDIKRIFKKWFELYNMKEIKPIIDFFIVPITNKNSSFRFFTIIQSLHCLLAKYYLKKKDNSFSNLMQETLKQFRQYYPELIDKLYKDLNNISTDADFISIIKDQRDYIAHGKHGLSRSIRNDIPLPDEVTENVTFAFFILLYSLILKKIGFKKEFIINRFREHFRFRGWLNRTRKSNTWYSGFYAEVLSKCNK